MNLYAFSKRLDESAHNTKKQKQETEHSSETKIIDEHNLIGNYSGDSGVMVLGDEDGYPTVDF
ncbi:MAG: hypothetical protein LN569_03515 [Rickettsia endosymbiont of Labidopullus appendiculatus]|nr:hypothetical protein [Rickettsia endosymbiont of Labidopullus appendiculatus]